jgi:acyl carrier protein
MVESPSVHEEHEIRDWLVGRLSEYLGRPADEIALDVPFMHYELDSVDALSLFGDIEDEYGFYLEPTVVWDHPTVSGLAAFVARQEAARAAAAERSGK